jgi:hypothetical protein
MEDEGDATPHVSPGAPGYCQILGPLNLDRLRSTSSSEHNPINQMDAEPMPTPVSAISAHPFVNKDLGEVRDVSEGPPELVAATFGGTLTPEFAALITVVQGMLQSLRDDIFMISARLDKREYRAPPPNTGTQPHPPSPARTQPPPSKTHNSSSLCMH